MLDPGGKTNATAGFVGAEGWHWYVTAVGWLPAGSHASTSLLHGDDAIRASAKSSNKYFKAQNNNKTSCNDYAADNNAKNDNDKNNDSKTYSKDYASKDHDQMDNDTMDNNAKANDDENHSANDCGPRLSIRNWN